MQHINFALGYLANDDHVEEVNQELLQEAIQLAQQANAMLLYIGSLEIMELEGFAWTPLQLPAQQNAMINACTYMNEKVVVILSNGGAIEMPWYYQALAILEGYLLGEAGGATVVDSIFDIQLPLG